MTEKEKMLAGMLYRVEPGSELLGEQARAKELCRRYNALPFGEETVIAYLYAKEAELTAIRTILASRRAGLDGAAIRERLRETYV